MPGKQRGQEISHTRVFVVIFVGSLYINANFTPTNEAVETGSWWHIHYMWCGGNAGMIVKYMELQWA
jgi:hypothetical protein